jgi:hypothetical protein
VGFDELQNFGEFFSRKRKWVSLMPQQKTYILGEREFFAHTLIEVVECLGVVI